jgi:uridine phosphorylase
MKRAQRWRHWACYHTQMWEWDEHGQRLGIVACAVGASFAVLVAEQLFVSGCELLISVGSAGQIADLGPPPSYIVIDRALRDEGTSYHYLPPDQFVDADGALVALADEVLVGTSGRLYRGASWTTDAPFRGRARNKPVLCVAYVTNRLRCVEGDFEEGDYNGARSSLSLIRALSERWRSSERKACPARGQAMS